jgi:hypothetical protein
MPAGAPSLGGARALAQVSEQAPACLFHEVQHFLKPVGSAVVRVGDVFGATLRAKLEEQVQPFVRRRRRAPVQHLQVLAIHGEDQVELLEVSRLDDARTHSAEIVSAASRGRSGARVGRLPDVIPGSTCRGHLDAELGSLTRRECAQYRLRRRGAADVAETYEQNSYHIEL